MPRAAIAATRHARVLRLPELAAFVDQETRRPASGPKIGPDPDLARQLDVFLEKTTPARGPAQPVERGHLPGMRRSAPAGGCLGAGEVRMPGRAWLVAGEPAGRAGGRGRSPAGSPCCAWKRSPGSTRSWPKTPSTRVIRSRPAASAPAPGPLARRPGRSAGCWNLPGEAGNRRTPPMTSSLVSCAGRGTATSEFDELLLMLKETRGFDFTGYKRSTLHAARPAPDGSRAASASLSEYRDYLELRAGGIQPALRQPAHQRDRLLPRPAGLAGAARGGAARAVVRQERPAARSGSGARAARPARRPTRSPSSWSRPWALDEFHRAG